MGAAEFNRQTREFLVRAFAESQDWLTIETVQGLDALRQRTPPFARDRWLLTAGSWLPRRRASTQRYSNGSIRTEYDPNLEFRSARAESPPVAGRQV